MKIRIEMPDNRELPSQGRNSGSIPDGGTNRFRGLSFLYADQDVASSRLRPGDYYRAFLEPDTTDAEFVFFVGWSSSNDKLIFEDGVGDLHVAAPDEIDMVSP